MKKTRKTNKRQNPTAKQAHRGSAAARRMKARAAKAKPKGKPPAALRAKPKREPRAVAPAPREVGLLNAIGEVMSVCEELAQEMHEWADNMPDSKQGSQKHDEVEAAADTLDQATSDDPCDGTPGQAFLNEVKIMIQDPKPSRRPRSRSARLSEATSILLDVVDKCEDVAADKATYPDSEQRDTAQGIKEALENIESDLQGVEFPGMFG